MSSEPEPTIPASLGSRVVDVLLPVAVGCLLAALFWKPLLAGAGFIGGDVYNYFLPLKRYYAEGLKQGVVRFWHFGEANGISVLGESQTGALYPFNLAAYRALDLIPAYNAVFLAHYVMTFVFTYWLARAWPLGRMASLTAALVFVYGWFPQRACLEWSITTGCWAPPAMLAFIQWLRRRDLRWLFALSLILALQLLLGHYQLAWVTLVGLGISAVGLPLKFEPFRATIARRLAVAPAIALGMALVAAPLFATWQFKAQSVRNKAEFASEVRYGRIPPAYLVELIAPFAVFADPDGWLRACGGDSNRIEAHLYFGLLPLAAMVFCILRAEFRRRAWFWILFGGVGMLLSTGMLIPLLDRLPGFSFFRYPGRYSLLAALGGAMASGCAVEVLVRGGWRRFLWIAAFCLTIGDFYGACRGYRWADQQVGYALMQNPPAWSFAAESPVFRRLKPEDRIFAPDPNTLCLSGASCVPHYIGLEPEFYHSLWSTMPNVFKGDVPPEPAVLATLKRAGVTHLLTWAPLTSEWPVRLLWSGVDPFLHRRLGRSAAEPLYLYKFDGPGRAWMEPATPVVVRIRPDDDAFEIELSGTRPGGRLRTTEWALPGWSASVDGKPVLLVQGEPFLVIDAPAGAKRAEFRFRQPHLHAWFIAAPVCAVLGFLAALWLNRRIQHC